MLSVLPPCSSALQAMESVAEREAKEATAAGENGAGEAVAAGGGSATGTQGEGGALSKVGGMLGVWDAVPAGGAACGHMMHV
jgi:hypothetical protein